jgi:hypothetical protein
MPCVVLVAKKSRALSQEQIVHRFHLNRNFYRNIHEPAKRRGVNAALMVSGEAGR